MGFAGLSIVLWVGNWCCWKKNICCYKLYHNPVTRRIFWWISFTSFCGIIASCISGIVIANKFRLILNGVKCAYERIYYDSMYGQLKDASPRWEGLKNNSIKLQKALTLFDNVELLQSICDYESNGDPKIYRYMEVFESYNYLIAHNITYKSHINSTLNKFKTSSNFNFELF